MDHQQTALITVTVDVLMVRMNLQHDGPEVLLIKRKKAPYQGMWALPGGKVNHDDRTLEDAAKREVLEETGVTLARLQQVATFGDSGRDPRGRYVSVLYRAILPQMRMFRMFVQAGDDAEDAQFFLCKHLPPLAFDHANLIQHGLDHIIPGLSKMR